MDIQSEVENEKFLTVFGSPYKSMCNLFTLKSGVIVIGIFDVIIGVINFIALVMEIIFLTHSLNYIPLYPQILISLTEVISLVFGLIGIRGMTRINLDDITLYRKFKVIELFVLLTLDIIKTISEGLLIEDYNLPLIIFFNIVFRVICGAIVKVVWSADVRLKYNETVLVMHGEEALKLMKQQAINLANPKVITPGMPIYVAPPYQQA
jgi:hypothetical protein